MRLHKLIVTGILLVIGIALCAINLWVTAARTLIPIAVSGVVESKEMRREKHAGIDDVYLVRLRNGLFEVDRIVFDALREGQEIQKESWSMRMDHGGVQTKLEWSQDVIGMRYVMPVAFGLLLMLAILCYWSRTPGHV